MVANWWLIVRPLPIDTISFPADYDATFCLGAFTAIIGLSGISSGDGTPNFLTFVHPAERRAYNTSEFS